MQKFRHIDESAMATTLVKLRGNKTQEKVAEDLGISKSALSMYEKGKRVPRDEIKLRIAFYYNRSLESIFFITK